MVFLRRNFRLSLSVRLQTFLVGLGVPKDILVAYTRRARKVDGLKHTFLMGVCDPTGMLPQGSIFIPGYCAKEEEHEKTNKNENDKTKNASEKDKEMKKERVLFSAHLERIFVTRSPCKEPTDGKLLPLVGTKPELMPDDVWEWLCNKPFGTIIFSRPKDRLNAAPLPALVGEGDLDGDYYFILFDKLLIRHLEKVFDTPRMRTEIRVQENNLRAQQVNLNEGPKFKEDISNDGDWFAAAQTKMLDVEYHAGVGKVIGTMWNLSEALAEKSEDGIWDRDARACAKASKSAIDTIKHGLGVELPSRLKNEVKESVHQYISWT